MNAFDYFKRREYQLLLFLVILNIIIRVPRTGYEIGADTFTYHLLSQSIVIKNHIKWIMHPASIFGLFPLSFPIGSPSIVAFFDILTLNDVGATIYYFSVIISVISVLASYLLACELSDNKFFRFFVAFSFSLFPINLADTTYSISARNTFVVLFLLCIWSLVRFAKTGHKKYFFFSLFFYFEMMMAHRLFIITSVVWIAFFVYKFYHLLGLNRNLLVGKILPIIYIFLFLSILSIPFLNIPFFETLYLRYKEGMLFVGEKGWVILANLIVDHVARFGFLLLLAPIGFFYSIKDMNKKPFIFLILLLLLSVSPLFLSEQYGTRVITPFYSILIGFGILFVIKKLKMKLVLPTITILLISSMFFSNFILYHRMGYYYYPELFTIKDSNVQMAFYIKDMNPDRTYIVNDGVSTLVQISAFAFMPFFPTDFQPIFKEMIIEDLEVQREFSFPPRTLWKLKDPFVQRNDWGYLTQSKSDSVRAKAIITKYNIFYAVRNLGYFTRVRSMAAPSPVFFNDVKAKKDKIYSNYQYEIYTL